MKILMLSIFAPHFFNWTEQLRDSGHKIYWLDIFDSNTKVKQIDFAEQITGWRYRWDHPGRYFLKKRLPVLSRLFNLVNERDFKKVFENKLSEIKPDIVHSFVMSQACVPVFDIMKINLEIKWVYSSWGSDLYFYENKGLPGANIKKVLPRINYMFSDCKRDYEIARRNGFMGEFLGVFPGGGGYNLEGLNSLMKPLQERNIILIKGYQGKHGRCIEVLKAIQNLNSFPNKMEVVVFGANREVLEFVSQTDLWFKDKLEIFGKIPHFQVMGLMGKATIYIGNSISDGMPNTLLESIIMGVFPVQSNPGGATAEIINHKENGMLISDPENIDMIEGLLSQLLTGKINIKKGIAYNLNEIKPSLEREALKNRILEKYKLIEKDV